MVVVCCGDAVMVVVCGVWWCVVVVCDRDVMMVVCGGGCVVCVVVGVGGWRPCTIRRYMRMSIDLLQCALLIAL